MSLNQSTFSSPEIVVSFFILSYHIMRQCWHTVPEDRPTFSELCVTISKFIEHIAGYLQVGYNPFTQAGRKKAVEEGESEKGEEEEEDKKEDKKEEKEKENEEEDRVVEVETSVLI